MILPTCAFSRSASLSSLVVMERFLQLDNCFVFFLLFEHEHLVTRIHADVLHVELRALWES